MPLSCLTLRSQDPQALFLRLHLPWQTIPPFMSQQIIKTARAPASVLFKVWNLSRAKQGVFQERTGRGFRKMSNKIPPHFPKTQLPKPQTLQQSGKASMFFSHTPQTKILTLSTLTGETQAPTPGTQTQLPPNLAYVKGLQKQPV